MVISPRVGEITIFKKRIYRNLNRSMIEPEICQRFDSSLDRRGMSGVAVNGSQPEKPFAVYPVGEIFLILYRNES